MAFNYPSSRLISDREGNSRSNRWWWLHQHFFISFFLTLLAFHLSCFHKPSPTTEKAIYLLLLYILTHSQMKNDQTFINRNWNWHIDGVLKSEHIFQKRREKVVVLLMSLLVSTTVTEGLETINRFNPKWFPLLHVIFDFSLLSQIINISVNIFDGS